MNNKTIEIVDSKKLGELKLKNLIGRTGCIVLSLDSGSRRNPGYIVMLDEPLKGNMNGLFRKIQSKLYNLHL